MEVVLEEVEGVLKQVQVLDSQAIGLSAELPSAKRQQVCSLQQVFKQEACLLWRMQTK